MIRIIAGEFLCEIGWVSAEDYRLKNDQFYADYQAGSLNMTAYLDFVLGPLAGKSRADVQVLQREFISQCVEPMLLDKAFELLNDHRIAGDTLLMMTATHAVVAEPVAARLGFEHWLGSGVGIVDECYTGRADGEPCFQEGKVNHLARWREQNPKRHKRPIPGFTPIHIMTCHCSRTWVIPWRLIPTPDSAHMPSRGVAGDLSSRLIAGFSRVENRSVS